MIKRFLQLVHGWPRHWRSAAQARGNPGQASSQTPSQTPGCLNRTVRHAVKIAELPLNRQVRPSGYVANETVTSTLYADHPDKISELSDAAYLCEKQRRYAAAERLYKNVLALRERRFGNQHLCVAASLSELAALYHSQSRYSEAHPLLQKALSIRRSLLTSGHPQIARSLHQLAESYYCQNQYGQAEPLLQEALSIFRRHLGSQHLHTQTVYSDLMKTITAAIQAGRFGDLSASLPPLDLNRLSETYSWAKPVWERPGLS